MVLNFSFRVHLAQAPASRSVLQWSRSLLMRTIVRQGRNRVPRKDQQVPVVARRKDDVRLFPFKKVRKRRNDRRMTALRLPSSPPRSAQR